MKKQKRTPRLRYPEDDSPKAFSETVGRALRKSAKAGRKTARMHGTPIYVWENGKVVAKKP